MFIYIFVSLIILITVIFLIHSKAPFESPVPGAPPSADGFLLCDKNFLTDASTETPGDIWCAIDFRTGIKRCPTVDASGAIYANLTTELCSRRDQCDYQGLPYSIFGDGSAGGGTCPDCVCTRSQQCPGYISSAFNPGNNINLENVTVNQMTGLPPISFVDPEFCFISSEILGNLSPGACISINGAVDLPLCTKLNPCISGQLAEISPGLFGCVSGIINTCSSSQYLSFDPSSKTTTCK